jgi:hypothetical protein
MAFAFRFARAAAVGIIAAVALPAAVLAAPPVHAPGVSADLVFAPGEICDDGIVLSNPDLKVLETTFAPHPDGSSRFKGRGRTPSLATDTTNGNTIFRRGGSSITITMAADGSAVADASGLVFAWYLPGDDSELGAGLFLVNGHAQERYAADGTFLSATFDGRATNVCEALAD